MRNNFLKIDYTNYLEYLATICKILRKKYNVEGYILTHGYTVVCVAISDPDLTGEKVDEKSDQDPSSGLWRGGEGKWKRKRNREREKERQRG